MSLHKSLKPKNRLVRRRNVLTRSERIERLEEDDRWDPEEGSVFGLPKVRPKLSAAAAAAKRARALEAAEEEEEEAEQEGEAAEQEAPEEAEQAD
ncbi:MAG: small basic protein [Candidatus Brocadiia bacterium]